jgi:hypothetical protein
MKRILLGAFALALASSPLASQAQLVRSTCSSVVHASGPHACTFILAGPVTGTATANPGADGIATVRLVLTADPRSVDGSGLIDPMELASCEATAIGGPATCSIDLRSDLRTPTPYVLANSDGTSLPGRCTATGSGDGGFSCLGGSI